MAKDVWHAGDEAFKRGVHLGLKAHGRRHQKSKTGVSVAQPKDKTKRCPPKIKKSYFLIKTFCYHKSPFAEHWA